MGQISVKPGTNITNSDICSYITFNSYALVEKESELIYFFNCYYRCGICGSHNQLSPNSLEDQLTKGRHAMSSLFQLNAYFECHSVEIQLAYIQIVFMLYSRTNYTLEKLITK